MVVIDNEGNIEYNHQDNIDKDIFYSKLVEALIKCDFRFSTRGFTEKDANTDHDVMSSYFRLAMKVAPLIFKVPFSDGLNAVFDPQEFQQKMDKIKGYGTLVCFKYLLSKPIIVAVAEADKLSKGQIVGLANKFDEAMVEMRESTGILGLLSMKSVIGILLLVYFDDVSASKFDEITQDKCKICHIWKQTNVVTWAINVSAKNLKRHSGIPILPKQVLDSKDIIQIIFQ
jgi:hypothetical protein